MSTRLLIALMPLAGLLPGAEPAPTTPQARPAGVPVDAVGFRGHFYRCYVEEVSWHAAKDRCEALGGHLCCISDQQEQEFISRLAEGRYLFLGATDEVEEGTFVWVDGSPFTYTCWLEGQPNNYGGAENYLATYDGGEWVDVAHEGQAFWMPTGFICEWDGAAPAGRGRSQAPQEPVGERKTPADHR